MRVGTRPLRLWLDDERTAPPGWVHARTGDEAKLVLLTGQVVHASFDHDLGASESSYDVLNWLEGRCTMGEGIAPATIRVHTANPPGRTRMKQAAASIARLAQRMNDEHAPARRLERLPEGIVDAILAAAQTTSPAGLQAIVLYGSRAYGAPRPESDIDVCLVLANDSEGTGRLESTIRERLPDALRDVVNLFCTSAEALYRYAGVPETMEAKVLQQGMVLWGAIPPESHTNPRETRGSVVVDWLAHAHRRLQFSFRAIGEMHHEKRSYCLVEMEYAYYAACTALRAALLAHAIDASHTELRWELERLVTLLSVIVNDIPDVSEAVNALPRWLYSDRYGYLREGEPSLDAGTQALVAARRLVQISTDAAQGVLAVPLTESHRALLIEDVQAAALPLRGFVALYGDMATGAAHDLRLRLLVVSDRHEAEVGAAFAGLEQEHHCKIAVLRVSLSQMKAELANASPFWRELLRGSIFSLTALEPLAQFLGVKASDR